MIRFYGQTFHQASYQNECFKQSIYSRASLCKCTKCERCKAVLRDEDAIFNNSKHKFTSTHDLLSSAEMKANISTKRVRLYYICFISKIFGSIKITKQSGNAISDQSGRGQDCFKIISENSLFTSNNCQSCLPNFKAEIEIK